jgi:hypothetical protein
MPSNPTAPVAQDYSYIIETGKDGVLDENTPRSHVEDVCQRAVQSGKPVVLHLHGGLVSRKSAYGIVNHLQPLYVAEGFFPIFIVWRTGLLDAVKNAEELVHRPLFQRLLVGLLKHLVARYGGPSGKSLGPGNEPDDAQIEEQLAKRQVGEVPYKDVTPQPDNEEMSDKERDALLKSVTSDEELRKAWELEVEAPEAVPGGKGLGMDDDVRNEAMHEFEKPQGKAILSGALLARHAVAITARVIKRFFNHRDHGLHTTIVEEILRELYLDKIGTEVWQFMKQDSADTFDREGHTPERGGWLLMRLMGEVVKQRQAAGQSLPIVSIVGHSAGCIYAGNLLSYLYQARLATTSPWNGIPFQLNKLVFLAPAATCKMLAAVLMKHDAAPLFQTFRMYSLADTDEKGYYEIAVLYPGSLLYIISGLLESEDDEGTGDMPLVGMQRYARPTDPFTELEVIKVWQFLKSKPKQLVWSGENGGPGLNCDSKTHGAFDDSPKTVNSFLHFLKEP